MMTQFGLIGLGQNGIIVSDSFNRTDSAVTPGSADTGQTWSSATYGISSNQLYNTASNFGQCLLSNMPVDQYTAQVTLATVDNVHQQFIIFRFVDTSNAFWAGNDTGIWRITRNLAGVQTSLGTGAGTPANGDVIKVTVNGTALKLYVNGTLKVSVVDANMPTGSTIGLWITQSTTARLDNFTIKRGLR